MALSKSTPQILPAGIPTPFARYHAELGSCRNVADLTDVAMRIASDPDPLPGVAQSELFEFANRRFIELRDQEEAA